MSRRTLDKEKAITLRKKGMSYSQIKKDLGISKSTLSGWLYNMPLSKKRIMELGANNPIRIERCRNTKLKHRMERLDHVYNKVCSDIGKISKRDLFIGGLFLYWGEGGKSTRYTTSFSNTDPQMVKFFIKWVMICFGVKRDRFSILIHLYKDMNISKSTRFWSRQLGLKIKQFSKPYIKDSKLTGLTYKNGFGKGTCNVRIFNRDITEYITQSLKHIRGLY